MSAWIEAKPVTEMTPKEWRLAQLVEAVSLLAQDADEQIAWIGPAHPDELALSFDDGFRLVPTLEEENGIAFSDQAKAELRQIDAQLKAMSGESHADLWTAQAIRSRPEWERIREQAKAAIDLLPSP